MFELLKEEKVRKEYKQFTLTIDKRLAEEIVNYAKQNNMKTHGFMVAILRGYLNYAKNENNLNNT